MDDLVASEGDAVSQLAGGHVPLSALNAGDGDPPMRTALRGKLASEVEAAMQAVIGAALSGRSTRGAKHYYSAVVSLLAGTGMPPPSRGIFARRFAAERKRRREALLQASADAAAAIAEAVGDAGIVVTPGEPPVPGAACAFAVRALAEWRSSRVGEAYGDYHQLSYRAGVRTVTPDVFRALVVSPEFVANVPRGLMPDWWLRKTG